MTIDHTRAFRDYATRVSFNLSMSRNQVATLRDIAIALDRNESMDEKVNRHLTTGDSVTCYVVGARWLESSGLIAMHPKALEDERALEIARKKGERPIRKYHGPYSILTPAGEHVVALLRIAGLIPQSVANSNQRRGRKARAA